MSYRFGFLLFFINCSLITYSNKSIMLSFRPFEFLNITWRGRHENQLINLWFMDQLHFLEKVLKGKAKQRSHILLTWWTFETFSKIFLDFFNLYFWMWLPQLSSRSNLVKVFAQTLSKQSPWNSLIYVLIVLETWESNKWILPNLGLLFCHWCREVPRGWWRQLYMKQQERERCDTRISTRLTKRSDAIFMMI